MSIEALEQRLAEVLEADLILRNEPMARHTTFKVGGPADVFVIPSSADEAIAVVGACRRLQASRRAAEHCLVHMAQVPSQSSLHLS